jgi:FKBP-type peptidyl-prolyl cis-trans isomerase FklB
MKLRLLLLLSLAPGLCLTHAEDKTAFKDQKAKTSYAVGINIGSAWKRQDIELDLEQVMKGIRETLAGQPQLTQQEVTETLRAYQTELRLKQEEKRKQLSDKNKADAEKYFAENKTKPGVITLPSGLQYKVVRQGDGPTPPTNSIVNVHYKATLLDGTELDNSYSRGKPQEFDVNNAPLKAWPEVLPKMKVGSKWQIAIPSELAYGERGFGGNVAPNAALLYEVELLGFKPFTPPPLPEPVTSDIIKVPSAEGLKKGEKIEIIKPDQLKKEKP